MSSPSKIENFKNDETLIEEIVKDINEQVVINDTRQPNGSVESSAFLTSPDEQVSTTVDSFEDDSSNLLDDNIDEETLKDLEIKLSDSEKEDRRNRAIDLKSIGNQKFKEESYADSIQFYTDGLRICPLKFQIDRSMLYANRAASKAKLNRKLSAIEDCSKAIELNGNYVKAYLRRAKLYEETEKFDESLEDYKKILEIDSGCQEALAAQVRLPPMINERNEKLKTEMLGKLKDLGNVILRPFGLSTDNFQLTQDPNSGSYSINFSQAPR
ncbi:tetratricopeptide repeat protein 1 [Cylas formicarius]|uniref:tetratricopeptide repeat protein 1 n=1 Tax=Cylas formicarius TaxID=197179 RepID=UPI002958B98E|nr:tetratricopeptide repeat protein 1 [Cylas formicarius]